jgi:glycosyltransferase involved in cell wall biosynthesis
VRTTRGRLLVVATGLGIGGTERHLSMVLPALAAHGMEIRVIALRSGGALAPELRERGVAVIEARALPGMLRLLAGFLAVAWHCLSWRPTVVHFFLPEAYLVGGVAAWLARRRPRAMSRRSLNAYQAAHPVASAVERWLHGRMDALLGNSRAVCAQLAAEGGAPERIGLLPNGVAPATPGIGRQAKREALGIEEGAVVVACVANLIPYKGHVDLIEAFGRAQGLLPGGSALLLVGRDEGIGGALAERAMALGVAAHVRFLGERKDVPELLAASDLFVLASHEEGSPNAVIEAMSAGLATIVTDVGGSPEAVGDAGLVVPPRDPDALSAALLRVGTDAVLRDRLGKLAAARAASEFSMEACVGRYLALYDALRSGRTASSALRAAH